MRAYYNYARLSIRGRQLERLEKAEENYDRLIQIFPDSPLVKDAESIYISVRSMMDSFDSQS